MRAGATTIALIATVTATAARSEVKVADVTAAQLSLTAILLARIDALPVEHRNGRALFHLGQASLLRTVAGGVDASPFVTALPGQMWHGRMHSFGADDGIGFSGVAMRAKSIDFGGLQSEHRVSGFLASQFRYGIAADEDDLLTVDLNAASQRMPAMKTIGYRKSIHISSLYLGAAWIHARHVSLTGGWYHVSTSSLSSFDYGVERTAGMSAPGQGIRFGLDWHLARAYAGTDRAGMARRRRRSRSAGRSGRGERARTTPAAALHASVLKGLRSAR